MHKAKVKIPLFLLILLNRKLLLTYLDKSHRARVMWCNATFNSISVISCRSALLEGTRIPGENHRPVASAWQTSSHNVVSSTPCHLTHNLSGDRHRLHRYSKSNYHTIMTPTAPWDDIVVLFNLDKKNHYLPKYLKITTYLPVSTLFFFPQEC